MKILIIDIETTGLNPHMDRIVEVGMVELDLATGEIKTVFDSLCHERPITRETVANSWIVKNGYITVEEVQRSPQFKDIKGQIQEIINRYEAGATAFNVSFDFDFLIARGIKIKKKLPCPMLLSTDICRIPHKVQAKGWKWPKAEEAYNFFYPGSNYKEKHRGADDAVHEAMIVLELYKREVFKVV